MGAPSPSFAVYSFDDALTAKALGLLCPEGGEGVDAVVVGGRLVAEDHDTPRACVEQDVEPAVGRDHCAAEAEARERRGVAGHGGHS